MQCNASIDFCLVVTGAGLGVRQAVTVARKVIVMRKRKRERMKSQLAQGRRQTPVTVSYLEIVSAQPTLSFVQIFVEGCQCLY